MACKIALCLSFLVVTLAVSAQVINTTTMDTVETTIIGHVGLGGYVDTYYGYNFNQPASKKSPYFVSSSSHNELTVNLAYVDVRYRSSFMRVRFVPAFGTYMDANYAKEPGSLRNMLEANVGILVFPKKKIWIDAGVLGSPYTNESAISKDHLMYTRSFAPEYVPYYISGVKATIPLSPKLNAYLFLINGWQVIQDNNDGKSFGTQLEYRPNTKMLFNWNTYLGDERSSTNPDFRMRYFTDFYWIYSPGNKWSATSSLYAGVQEMNGAPAASWWQANLIGKYAVTEQFSLSARLEYFHDAQGIIAVPITGATGFKTASYGVCANFNIHKLAVFRIEARRFSSQENVYVNKDGNSVNNSTLLITSLTAWF